MTSFMFPSRNCMCVSHVIHRIKQLKKIAIFRNSTLCVVPQVSILKL